MADRIEVKPMTEAERARMRARSAALATLGKAEALRTKETCTHKGSIIRCKKRRGFFFICKRCKQRVNP